MYTTREYPVDIALQVRKQRERAHWRRRKASTFRRLLGRLAPR